MPKAVIMEDDSLVLAELVEPARPWGVWPTLGLSLVVFVVWTVAQTAVLVAAGAVTVGFAADTGHDLTASWEELASQGWMIGLSVWIGLPAGLGLIVLLVKVRRPWSVTEYLALQPAPWGRTALWLVATALFAAASDLLTWLLGRPIVPDFMRQAYQRDLSLPLLWSAVVIAAPVMEELFFRGFLFRGLHASRLGAAGAIAITSLAWGCIHLQYDLYQIGTCVAIGVLLGLARVHTGSTYVVIAMHALTNLIATVEAHLLT